MRNTPCDCLPCSGHRHYLFRDLSRTRTPRCFRPSLVTTSPTVLAHCGPCRGPASSTECRLSVLVAGTAVKRGPNSVPCAAERSANTGSRPSTSPACSRPASERGGLAAQPGPLRCAPWFDPVHKPSTAPRSWPYGAPRTETARGTTHGTVSTLQSRTRAPEA